MSNKISITETQLLLFDIALGIAMKTLMGEYKKILSASEEELKQMKDGIDNRFKSAMDKIKNH